MSIKRALKDGSANPISNTRLADALELAKKNNMPKSTINSIIENSQKAMVNAKESLFEYRGINGLCLMVVVFTDNPKRPRGFINAIMKKYGFKEDKQQGGVRHMFKERGLIVTEGELEGKYVSFSDAEDHAIEVGAEEVEVVNDTLQYVSFSDAEDHAIEVGAEEVEVVNDTLQFVCDAGDLSAVRSGLKKLGYAIESCEIEFIPNNPVALEDDQMESLIACVTKLEDLEEVVKVHANAA
ncbi:Transcriptional regulator TACO1-like [Trinorchestia longiramus]|nr:Transcriptional regulator TACO1-like [Trinorchestia longiramus]